MNTIKGKLIDIVIIGVVLFGAALCLLNAYQLIKDITKDDTSIYVSAEGLNSLESKADHMSIVTAEQDEKPYSLIHETFKVVGYDGEYYESINVNDNKDKGRLYFTGYDVKGNEGITIGDTVTSVHLDDSEQEDLFLFVYKDESNDKEETYIINDVNEMGLRYDDMREELNVVMDSRLNDLSDTIDIDRYAEML